MTQWWPAFDDAVNTVTDGLKDIGEDVLYALTGGQPLIEFTTPEALEKALEEELTGRTPTEQNVDEIVEKFRDALDFTAAAAEFGYTAVLDVFGTKGSSAPAIGLIAAGALVLGAAFSLER